MINCSIIFNISSHIPFVKYHHVVSPTMLSPSSLAGVYCGRHPPIKMTQTQMGQLINYPFRKRSGCITNLLTQHFKIMSHVFASSSVRGPYQFMIHNCSMTELRLLISHTSRDQVIGSSVIRACCQITLRLIVHYLWFRNPQNNKSAAFNNKKHTFHGTILLAEITPRGWII